jgi:hypothetical protein
VITNPGSIFGVAVRIAVRAGHAERTALAQAAPLNLLDSG